MRIKTVSDLTGIPIGTITAWERRYDLLRPERAVSSGYRIYTDDDVALLQRIRSLLDQGYKISEAIARLQVERREPTGASAHPDDALLALRTQLEQHLLQFDRAAADALRQRLVLVPFRHAIDGVYLPLLTRIGEGWERGTVTVAQEHFASAWCRDQLVGMLLAVGADPSGGPRALCAGFPGEQHELGLLAVAVKLALLGVRVTYLGPDLPTDELVAVAAAHPAELVCVSVMRDLPSTALRAFAEEVAARLPSGSTLVLGGPGAAVARAPAGVWVAPRFEDLAARLHDAAHPRVAHAD
jgi:MerR family transcriptional regulator, light-induced transcriptional regulator